MRICSSREALLGIPEPPLDSQVLSENCSPPKYPFPVFMAQFPLDSHWAMASQLTLSAEAGAASAKETPAARAVRAVVTFVPNFKVLPLVDPAGLAGLTSRKYNKC